MSTSSDKTIIDESKIDLRKSIIIPNREEKQDYVKSENTYIGKKKVYDLVDEILKTITLERDIIVRLISNNNGLYIDFRKYFKGYPTKKGIRVYAAKFKEIYDLLEEDINKYTK